MATRASGVPRGVRGQDRLDGRDLRRRPVEPGDRVPDHREYLVGGLLERPVSQADAAGPVDRDRVLGGQAQRRGQALVPVHLEGPDERGQQQPAVRAGRVDRMQVAAPPVRDGEVGTDAGTSPD